MQIVSSLVLLNGFAWIPSKLSYAKASQVALYIASSIVFSILFVSFVARFGSEMQVCNDTRVWWRLMQFRVLLHE